ncbi:MAG: sensor histidine kinase [Anaerolineae bacterium]
MFKTLRAKIIVSYALIVFLCLFLAGSASVFLFNRYQEGVARRNMRLLAVALVSRVPSLLAQREALPEVARRLRADAKAVGARLLLLDAQGVVIADTASEGELVGQRLELLPPDLDPRTPRRIPIGRHRAPDGQEFLYITVRIPTADRPPLPRPAPHFMALAVPLRDVRGAWRELAPSLIWIGGLALVVSVVVGFFLSRSITRPLEAMTVASEEMAQGRYEQEIAVEGADEVARLARAFNTMAREVARAHRMQRDLVANVSHDLKTPLTAIQGFAQALLDGTAQDEEAYRKSARIISEEAERMSRLIHDLLELARLESGQAAMVKEPMDLLEVLSACAEKFAPRADQEEVSLKLSLPPTLPQIRGDAHRLEQAFTNLLDNAFKYTPAGGSVELAAYQTSEENVEVVVADTGVGIPPEDLPRIFERFYRIDKARTGGQARGRSSGTGLGLAIVKEIVQAHGGRITAASQEGRGSRFTVTLPAQSV